MRRQPQDFLNSQGSWEGNTLFISFPPSLSQLLVQVGPKAPLCGKELEWTGGGEKKTAIVR